MKNKTILGIIVFIIFLFTAGSIQVYADSTTDNYNNYVYPMSTYKKPVIQPFSFGTSGQAENINPINGGLEITQTDLSLKGKNGLDFNLTRIYSTTDALLYEPNIINEPYYTFLVQGYYITGTEVKETYVNGVLTGTITRQVPFCAPVSGSTTGLPYAEMPQSFPEFVYSTYWSTSQQAQKMADDFNAGIYDTSVISGTTTTVIKYGEIDDFTVQMRYQLTTLGGTPGSAIPIQENYLDSVSNLTATDKYFNLGTGWSLDLPYIETRGMDNYLNLGSKGLYHFTFDRFQWALNSAYMIPGYDYNIPIAFDGYELNDIKLYHLIYKNTQPYYNSQMYAYFMLVEKDGKTSYFGSDGRILGIKDRFGNEIRFLHTIINSNPVISQVIDSVGRNINLTYETSKVTVDVVDNTNAINNRQIIYNKSVCPSDSSEYLLTSVKDAEGRVTQYTYEQKSGNFCYRRKDPYPSNIGTSYYECLKSIIYPTGGKTEYIYNDGKYTYQNLGISGFMHFNKITERADYAKDGTKYNQKSYEYYNYFNGDGTLEYDGYPTYSGNSVPDGYQVKTKVTDTIGNAQTHTFSYIKNPSTNNNDRLCTNILYLGADNKKEIINSYNIYTKLLEQCINRTYNKSTGAYMDKIENYSYDNLKNVLYYWDPQANGNKSDTEHKIAYTYGSNNILTSKTYKRDANNTVNEQYTLSSDGKTVTLAQVHENSVLKKKTAYSYDVYGNVTEQKDYLDNWTDFISTHYDYTDNVSSRNGKFNGLYLTKKWTGNIKDADGNSITAWSTNSPGTIDEVYWYDWFGNVTQKRDGQGGIWKCTYDKLDRVKTEMNSDNTEKIYSYITTLVENSVLATNEKGTEIKTVFDEFGNLLYTLDVISGKHLNNYAYDSLFRLNTEDNHNDSIYSRSITYQYYGDGRIKQCTAKDKAGNLLNQENFTYNDASSNGTYNKITKTITGDGNSPSISTITYLNKLGQVEKQGSIHNGAEILDTYKYDYLGNKIEEKNARAYQEGWSQTWTAKYEYNYAGKLTKTYDINNNYTTNDYDALGRLVSVTDPKGNIASPKYSSTYVYDALNRLIEEKSPFMNISGSISYSIKRNYYDRNGNLILQKTSSNKPGSTLSFNQTAYGYSNRNMLVKVTTYNGTTPENYTQYHYDAVGNKVRQYTGLNTPLTINGLDQIVPGADNYYSITRYDYDRFGRLTRMTDPMGKYENNTYDTNGNLTGKTDRNEDIINNVYDGLGRLISTSVTTSDGSGNASHSYSYVMTGMRKGMDGTTYLYDDLGRLLKETEGSIVKEYTYDAANNRKSFILKKGGNIVSSTTYTYDNMNRLYQVLENNQLKAAYSYDENGNRKTLTYTNGDSTIYDYNLANSLTILTNKKGSSILSKYDYEYYLNGNQAKKSENTGKVTNYTYDGLGRLLSESVNTGDAISYTYDDSNNRKTMTVSGSSPSVTSDEYNLNNCLVSETKTEGTSTYTTNYWYDNNGNQICKSTETIAPVIPSEAETYTAYVAGTNQQATEVTLNKYNGFNQLINTTSGDQIAVYTYNGDGLRTSKTVNGISTNHIWDGDQVAAEVNGAGTITGKYIRGINLLYGSDGAGANQKWYLFNGHGDVVQLSGSDGNVVKTYDYDAFGNEENIDNTDTNLFRYCGEYFDKETGTIYLRARYYDPEIGRFITEDSYLGEANDPLSLNLYTYCWNNPVIYIDKNGNNPILAIFIILAKGVDYGWTAWDVSNDFKIIFDSSAIFVDKFAAATDITMAVAFEGLEPDELSPIGLPVDDIARRALMKSFKTALKEGGLEGGYKMLRGIMGNSADTFIRQAGKLLGSDIEIMHLLPQAKEFKKFFKNAGLDINDFKIPLDKAKHRLLPDGVHTGSENWNKVWRDFMTENKFNATADEILEQLAKMREQFGI